MLSPWMLPPWMLSAMDGIVNPWRAQADKPRPTSLASRSRRRR
jgi:hypothetical protein